ncbi:dihydroxyacetone kinase subunit DhaK [Pullulanibacillus sp. KACC 23026]|uniref:dihydroxyacetone kinase subunit DhaK n=1 Tax=Pullulanibacillus sp. KACC 23026 TaxID=3028315 RepID=UPI0023B0DBFA|nr:dihydroxyacetone kinase subunit DhaK [Pullulanibacillus sp. KACC 23026]WEG11119.1 dihydroxyacetone kinase subunit DhaK [Pullulanibacillus sp. KACC 23026]
MKKILNDPNKFVDESLAGILLAHPDQLRGLQDDPRAVVRADAPVAGKVAIATGGGYGHLPVFLGYVGKGLADGVCVGNVFTSPSADSMLAVAKEINSGSGVLFLYGNYFGDKMNFELAQELAEEEGIQVEAVRVTDDVTSAPFEQKQKRRGVAGIFFAYKIAGACAESGASLEEVKCVAEKTVENIRSMGIGFTPATIPASGNPSFEIDEDEVEIGIGIHGEPGIFRQKAAGAKEYVNELMGKISKDLGLSARDEVAVLVNGLGSSSLEELYIGYREVYRWLDEKQIKIYRPFIGEYGTSLEMGGFSLSILKLDDELKTFLDEPARSPFISI